MSHGFLPSSEEWSGKIRARKALLPVGRAAPAAGLPERFHGKHNVFSGQDGSFGRSGETPFPPRAGPRRGRGGGSDGKRGQVRRSYGKRDGRRWVRHLRRVRKRLQREEAEPAGAEQRGRAEKRRTAGGGNRPDRKTFMQGAEL